MADVSQIKLPNGSVYDLIDEKSGYITAQYIENKTDYEIPVSRVGEIVVGETAIGTDSTNFPTSKAVVDYVDERVVQEMDAIDVGVTGIKANGTSLAIENGVVNIPAIGRNQSIGLMTDQWMQQIWNGLNSIPTSTSQLTNDSGFITSETDPTVPAWAKASSKPTYTAAEVGALPDSTVITDEKLKTESASNNIEYYPILGTNNTSSASTKNIDANLTYKKDTDHQQTTLTIGSRMMNQFSRGILFLCGWGTGGTSIVASGGGSFQTITLPNATGTVALTSDIPTVPTNISSFTNDSGYITSYTETDPTVPSWAKQSSKPSYALSELTGAADVQAIEGLTGTSGLLKKTAADTWTLDTSTYLTSYTETDPVFTASAAYGITSTDISNWNAKVSDTGKWNNVSLDKTVTTSTSDQFIPCLNSASATSAKLILALSGAYSAYSLAQRDGNGYIIAQTPSANDNSTKVATTAYVDRAIPQVYSSTNTGGYLTMATLPIYDGTVV